MIYEQICIYLIIKWIKFEQKIKYRDELFIQKINGNEFRRNSYSTQNARLRNQLGSNAQENWTG